MIDVTTQKRLIISKEENSRPYLMVPVSQLAAIRAVLDANQISYWVDEIAISLDGKPAKTVINFYYKTDPAQGQQLLDSIS